MPAVTQDAQHLPQLLDLGPGEPAGRLVEEDEARPHDEAARDLQEALLGMLEQAGGACQGVAEADAVQHLHRKLAHDAVLATGLRQGQGAGEEAAAGLRPAAQHGIVEHAQAVDEAGLLEGAGDAEVGPPLDAGLGQVLAAQPDRRRHRHGNSRRRG